MNQFYKILRISISKQFSTLYRRQVLHGLFLFHTKDNYDTVLFCFTQKTSVTKSLSTLFRSYDPQRTTTLRICLN